MEAPTQLHLFHAQTRVFNIKSSNLTTSNKAATTALLLLGYYASVKVEHRSPSYTEVWHDLKVLDAANVDRPQASSGIKFISGKQILWRMP
ncbi:hypothetical protein NC652_034484 [Populus alba x Populus x berolinensis]|nr:hypothetical protein NC652_034484 [Populus alba x Populus x berolinensis]